MTNENPNSSGWSVVVNTHHLQLSAIDPPDARVPGPVIGPNSRVRPCDDTLSASESGFVCLEVETDGGVERGYTIKRMVALAPVVKPNARLSPFAIATPMVLVLVIALFIVFV